MGGWLGSCGEGGHEGGSGQKFVDSASSSSSVKFGKNIETVHDMDHERRQPIPCNHPPSGAPKPGRKLCVCACRAPGATSYMVIAGQFAVPVFRSCWDPVWRMAAVRRVPVGDETKSRQDIELFR